MQMVANETAYGMETTITWVDGKKTTSQNLLPNLTYRGPQWTAKSGKDDPAVFDRGHVVGWKLPIDDERHHFFQIEAFPSGEHAERYVKRREQWLSKASITVEDAIEKVFKGEMHLDDFSEEGVDVHWLNLIEDGATQTGQGVFADRTAEHLGRTDTTVILLRKIWQRELRNLAEGRPLKRWTPPPKEAARMW
jgi:hypothetical protein